MSFAIRLGYCEYRVGLGHTLKVDYREYIMSGARLLSTGSITSSLILDDALATEPAAIMPPIYTFLVAQTYSMFGAESFTSTFLLQLINALATSLAVLIVFSIVRQLSNHRAAWIAAIIAAINPSLFGYTHMIWDTSLFILAVALTLWFSVLLKTKRTCWYAWAGYGIWLGLIAMLNPSLTLAYPFLVLWPMMSQSPLPSKDIIRFVSITVVGWVITITPWTMRNYHHFDRLMYIRSGIMLELWLGVCPEAETNGSAVYTNQFSLKNNEVQQKITSIGEQSYLSECGEKAISSIKSDPLRYIKLTGVRVVDYWLGTVFSHTPPGGSGWPVSFSRSVVTFFLSVELILFFGCLMVQSRIGSHVRWLIAMMVMFSLVYCATHIQIRYRAPSEPIMAVILGILLSDSWLKFTSKHVS